MKKLLFVLTLTSYSALAQGPPAGAPGGSTRPQPAAAVLSGTSTAAGSGKITGTVVDAATKKPVPFATVALINTATGKPVDGASCDDNGKFTISQVGAGTYQLQVSFLGYKTVTNGPLTVTERGGTLNQGTIALGATTQQLGEVVVQGQKQLIEEKVDRLVYNADQDVTAKGGDATDIMRKVPLLAVDLDGNVTLRGSSNVTVLINNKPSTIVASSVADALKQIPADLIQTVEVITSPSAKYDAEGSAGIINIVTKKNTLAGKTLNVDIGGGNRGASLNLNGNYRKGKMGFNLGGFGRSQYNVHGSFNNNQTIRSENGDLNTIQSADTRNRGLFGNYQLGWDYDITEKSSLTANIRYGVRNNITNQDNLLTETYSLTDYALLSSNARNVETKDLSGTVDANLTYTHTYAPQKELSILGLYSRNNRTNDFVADLLTNDDISQQRNNNESYNQESTIQVDYSTPLQKNQLLEFGGKGIFRQVNSHYTYYLTERATGAEQVDVNRPNNTLNYNQNITASYLSYTYTTQNKYTLKAGARYEYTFIDAHFSNNSEGQLSSIPNYGKLIPSLNLSKSFEKGQTIKLAYNRRIQRPGIQFLNPNTNSSNPTNITVGNPYLAPELTDNLELGFSTQLKAFYINASVFGRRSNNSITSVRDTFSLRTGDPVNPVLQQGIRTSYQNIGREDNYGINLFTNATFFSKWQIGGGIDLYYADLTNNVADPIYRASNSGWVISGRLNSSLTLPNDWTIQAFGGARGRQIQLQGYQGTFAFYNLGIRKQFNDKRGSFGISGENFANFPFVVRSELTSPILTQSTKTSFYNAGVRFNFSYRIGKIGVEQPRKRRRSIENDDIKGGDNGGGDVGGQPAAPQQAAPAAPSGGRRGARP
ncbi:TonB-dependent receptor domain-containing protein [Hymenobacter cavernae]|uniref:TonB-dependent receptor domain-containing protein n=1 Tax=Hymenobacter cavernae TaxID=2044852 RepID=UPI00166BBEAF|nr:outer membrane beta-barrel family protein [Hymenobacter cavernae]